MNTPDLPPGLNFDGCGISSSGQRLLTGSRADWDKPQFKALGAAVKGLPEVLRSGASLFAATCGDEEPDNTIRVQTKELYALYDALIAAGCTAD